MRTHPLAALVLALSSLVVAASAHAKQTTEFPEVIALFSDVSFDGKDIGTGRCTGTWIHPRLLLTAAHCVRHFNVMEMGGHIVRATNMSGAAVADDTARPDQVAIIDAEKWWGNRAAHPARVLVSPYAMPVDHPDLNLDYVAQDLAILEFAEDRAPRIRHIAQHAPAVGVPLEQVGFGSHGGDHGGGVGFGASAPLKFYGRNSVSALPPEMLVTNGNAEVCTTAPDLVDDWALCGGDSGGPLFDARNGELLGVASASIKLKDPDTGLPTQRKLSVFTDLTSPRAAEFIQKAIENVGQGLPPAPPAKGRRGD